jgi:hypothetical protein
VVRRNALDPFGQEIAGRRMADVAQTKDADHPLALVDHRQPADLERLHVPYRLGEVVVLPAAMDARGHLRHRCLGSEAEFTCLTSVRLSSADLSLTAPDAIDLSYGSLLIRSLRQRRPTFVEGP